MRLTFTVLVLSAATFSFLAVADTSRGQDRWAIAAASIVRLKPAAFKALPKDIVAWLDRAGYSVPQSFCDDEPHNVVKANLDGNEDPDWAALCSRADTSWIVVFWNGRPDSVSVVEPMPDATYLQTTDAAGSIGYSRLLRVDTADDILFRYQEWEFDPPSGITHDGLWDVFCEKAGATLYWKDGKLEYLFGGD